MQTTIVAIKLHQERLDGRDQDFPGRPLDFQDIVRRRTEHADNPADLAAHADMAELALDHALHRAGDFRDGEFRGIPAGGRVFDRDDPALDSVVALYPGAAWHEREVHEMFGVRFMGNPDLSPLLTTGDMGFPLRRTTALPARVARTRSS